MSILSFDTFVRFLLEHLSTSHRLCASHTTERQRSLQYATMFMYACIRELNQAETMTMKFEWATKKTTEEQNKQATADKKTYREITVLSGR